MNTEKRINIKQEASRCLLCYKADCTKACIGGMDPVRGIRAIRFDNEKCAGMYMNSFTCGECPAPCEKACPHYDFPIRIKAMAKEINKTVSISTADLSIDFCGVRCENPFFLSSSIIASNYEMCAKAFDKGWGGVVFKTVGFLIPDEVSPRFDAIGKEGTPFVGFKNLEQISDKPLEENLATFRKLKKNYPEKVLVASIMGQTDEEWTELAKLVTEAGADIIECNFSCPHMSGEGLGSDVGQNPQLVKRYTEMTKKGTHIPVLAKMTPNLGHMEIPAIASVQGGADGIAAINTIKSLTGVNLDLNVATPSVGGKSSVSGYSGKAVKPIALRFISDLAKCSEVNVPLSGMGGIETWRDALEFIALGCSNIQITTSVMQYGYRIIDDLVLGLSTYMMEKGVNHVGELVGTALQSVVSADTLDRGTIEYPLFNKNECIGCGRCYIACYDAGHQAISFDEIDRTVKLDGKSCVGCHLCKLVCPVGAIGDGKRIPKKLIS